MTLTQIVDNIALIAYKIESDDSNVSHEQIKFWVNMYRARLVKEYYDKRQYIDSFYVQDLGCIPLECVDACCNIVSPLRFRRSKLRLPQFTDLPSGASITFIGLVDKVTPIPIYDPNRLQYSEHSRFSKKTRKAFLIDGYIYIDTYPHDPIEYINVRMILADPEKAKEFNQCGTGEVCYSDEQDYPIPAHLIQILTEMIIKNELSIQFNLTPMNDLRNNFKEDIVGQQQSREKGDK